MSFTNYYKNLNDVNLNNSQIKHVSPEMSHHDYNYIIPSNLFQKHEKMPAPPHEDINSLFNPNTRNGGGQIYGMSEFYANNRDNGFYSNKNVGLDKIDPIYAYEPPTITGMYQSNYAKYANSNLSNQHKLQALRRFKQLNTNPIKYDDEEGFKQSEQSERLEQSERFKLQDVQTGGNLNNDLNDILQPKTIKQKISERFFNTLNNDRYPTDEMYKSIMNGYIHAIYNYVSVNKMYSHFKRNWDYLKRNIQKSTPSMLNVNDKDVAYVENKGESIKFQFRNVNGYIPKKIYTYVCLHEIAHMCFEDSFIGHDSPFPQMLCVLCVAGYELQLFDLKKISTEMYYSDNRPIGSKDTIKSELYEGIEILKKYNPECLNYYDSLKNRIKNE